MLLVEHRSRLTTLVTLSWKEIRKEVAAREAARLLVVIRLRMNSRVCPDADYLGLF